MELVRYRDIAIELTCRRTANDASYRREAAETEVAEAENILEYSDIVQTASLVSSSFDSHGFFHSNQPTFTECVVIPRWTNRVSQSITHTYFSDFFLFVNSFQLVYQ